MDSYERQELLQIRSKLNELLGRDDGVKEELYRNDFYKPPPLRQEDYTNEYFIEEDVIDFVKFKTTLYGIEPEFKITTDEKTAVKEDSQMLLNMKGVSIGNTPRRDGRIQGRWKYDETKPPKYYYGKTQSEVAQLILADIKRGAPKFSKKNTDRLGKNTKLRIYLAEWRRLYKISKPKIKVKTIKGIDDAIATINKRFGDYSLRDIEKASFEIQEYLLTIRATRSRELALLYLNAAMKKAVPHILRYNPCDSIDIPEHEPRKVDALTQDEQVVILNALREFERRDLYQFLLEAGVRIGEALALENTDFFIFKGKHFAHIRKTIVTSFGKENAQEFLKTHDGIQIVRMPYGEAVLQNYPKTDAGMRVVYIPNNVLPTRSGYIFPYSYGQVQNDMERLSRMTGIHMHANRLRHTYSTRLEERHIPSKVKAALMGHSDEKVTQKTYTDVQLDYLLSFTDIIDGTKNTDGEPQF